jgi:SH3 domain-containing YSC84-like protein 1
MGRVHKCMEPRSQFTSYIAPAVIAGALLFAIPPAIRAENANDRLKEAAEVLTELTRAEDKGIPRDLLAKAHCAVIIPGAKKGGFFVGAQYGRGFAICRDEKHKGWGAPAAVRMEGGSIGLQIGAAETDIFMLVMTQEGMEKLLESKFTLDASAGVAAGPVGRASRASTDTHLTAGILSWSRSRGAFAGMTIGGGTLRNDLDENKELYGKPLTNKEVLTGNVDAPASAAPLVATLNRLSRVEEGTRARPSK